MPVSIANHHAVTEVTALKNNHWQEKQFDDHLFEWTLRCSTGEDSSEVWCWAERHSTQRYVRNIGVLSVPDGVHVAEYVDALRCAFKLLA